MPEKQLPKVPKPPPLPQNKNIEQTGPQRKVTVGGVAGYFGGGLGVLKPPPGTFAIYRSMRENPTIALARIAATVPIRIAGFAVTNKDGTPEDRVAFIKEQMTGLWDTLIRDMLYALDYGFQAFEKVWQTTNGQWTYRKLKPLTPDFTQALVDKKTGTLDGLKNDRTILPIQNIFWYTYDSEGTNPYGRSRHDNIRKYAWHPWTLLAEKELQYGSKIAGVIPIIEYPEGNSEDADGAIKDNFDLAKSVLASLGSGKGVAMPNVYSAWAGDLARNGVDLEKLKAWHITFLETKGNHAEGFVKMLRHLESLMLRGWIVPERAVTEGQSGTKAEAQTHGQLAIAMADLVYQDMIRYINWHLINPLLIYNYGVEAQNTVWIERPGLDPAIADFLRTMLVKVLGAPGNVDLFLDLLDVEAIIDNLGLPKAKDNLQETINRGRKDPDNQNDDGAGDNGRSAAARFTGPLSRMASGIYADINQRT